MPTYFNKILADLWCLLTSELSAAVVTLILVLLCQTLWLCRAKQPGSNFVMDTLPFLHTLMFQDAVVRGSKITRQLPAPSRSVAP